MEQKLATGLCKGQIAEFIKDQEVEAGDQICGSPLSFGARSLSGLRPMKGQGAGSRAICSAKMCSLRTAICCKVCLQKS